MQLELPTATAVRRLKVTHANHYEYDQPVVRSVHRVRLRPIHDLNQTLQSYRLQISTEVETVEFEDVFGNWVTQFEIHQPYNKLSITAESLVELLDADPFAFAAMSVRPKLPILWMPWEMKMLAPYLAPIELPDTQLAEIYEYAQSFVAQNDQDLLETLFAMNLAFFREFSYQPASTSLETTPFEVLVNKRGVCQDFSNLMICMARMLNIPARYVCGYVFTGNTGEARRTATPRTPGCSCTCQTSVGRVSIRPTASCRPPITYGWPWDGITATRPPRPARCIALPTNGCTSTWMSHRSANSPLKNALSAVFNLATLRARSFAKSQNNDLRCYFGIASLRLTQPVEYFNRLLTCASLPLPQSIGGASRMLARLCFRLAGNHSGRREVTPLLVENEHQTAPATCGVGSGRDSPVPAIWHAGCVSGSASASQNLASNGPLAILPRPIPKNQFPA